MTYPPPPNLPLLSPIDRTYKALLSLSEAPLNLHKVALNLFRALIPTTFILTQDIIIVPENYYNDLPASAMASFQIIFHTVGWVVLLM